MRRRLIVRNHWCTCEMAGFVARHAFERLAQGAATPSAIIDWPQFRFDDKHYGVNPFEHTLNRQNTPTLSLSWQAQLGEMVDYSSPTVAGGVVYIGRTDGTLVGLSGRRMRPVVLRYAAVAIDEPRADRDSPTVANGVVYIGSQTDQDNNDGRLNAFSASRMREDGLRAALARRWRATNPFSNRRRRSRTASSMSARSTANSMRSMPMAAAKRCASRCGRDRPALRSIHADGLQRPCYVGSDDGNLYVFKAKGCGKTTARPNGPARSAARCFNRSPAIAKGLSISRPARTHGIRRQRLRRRKIVHPVAGLRRKRILQRLADGDGGICLYPWATGLAVYAADGCGGARTCGETVAIVRRWIPGGYRVFADGRKRRGLCRTQHRRGSRMGRGSAGTSSATTSGAARCRKRSSVPRRPSSTASSISAAPTMVFRRISRGGSMSGRCRGNRLDREARAAAAGRGGVRIVDLERRRRSGRRRNRSRRP